MEAGKIGYPHSGRRGVFREQCGTLPSRHIERNAAPHCVILRFAK
jgi:hypothetical protein